MRAVAGRRERLARGAREFGIGHVALLVSLAYLALAVPFSLLTPAWENNDEREHVEYVEHVARDGTPPRIALANGTESHQAPLYYYLAAGIQQLAGIAPFTPHTPPASGLESGFSTGIYVYSHAYTPGQHRQATDVHVLRLVSIACGLITVLAAVATAWLLTRRLAFAAAVGVAVSLWPKFLVITSAVTNSALTIALCAAAIPAFLMWRRSRALAWAAAIGAILGAAALSEETALPIVGVILASMVALAWRPRDWRGPLIAVGCLAAVGGWWYVRNTVLYGDPLASSATRDYLGQVTTGAPFLRVPPSLSPSVLSFGVKTLAHSTWYDAGWNQIRLPNALDLVVCAVAAASLAGAALRPRLRGWLVLVLCALGSLLAWLVLLAETNQGEGRYLLLAIAAWSPLLVAGAERVARRSVALWLWPAIFVGLDVYVLARFLIPNAHP